MQLIHEGDYNSLNERANKRLMEAGFTTNNGSVVKLLTSIINSEIEGFYTLLNEYHLQAFVSTATDKFLNQIGILLNCRREDDEEDRTYRERITKQILKTATSNQTSIKIAALSVEGVTDVQLINNSHGTGTFTVIVESEEYETSQLILNAVKETIKEVVAYGVNFIVDKPINEPIELEIKLLLGNDIDEYYAKDIQILVKENIKKYINSLKIGDPLIINELTERIMSSNKNITDYVCTKFKVNDRHTIYIDQISNWGSRFTISNTVNAIVVT